MHNLSRHLRPVVAVALAIALAGGGAVAGRLIATPTESTRLPSIEAVPVIAPVAYGDAAPEFDPDDAMPASPITGELDVAVGAPVAALGADRATLRALADIATSEDPEGAVSDELTLYALGGADDPCAGSGPQPDGCPAGLEGAVLALSAPPPFEIRGILAMPPAVPSTTESPACPPASLGEGRVQLGIATNAPAHVVVEVAIGGRPVVTEFDTAIAAADNWRSVLADATEFSGAWTTVRSCGVISGLQRGTAYPARVVASSANGQFQERSIILRSDGIPTAPQPTVFAVTDDYIMAMAPHRADQVVSLLAYSVTTPYLDCPTGVAPGGFSLLRELGTWRQPIKPTWLAARNHDPRYTKNTVIAYAAPEGSTLLFCITVESGGDIARYSSVVQTADRATPDLTLYSVDFRRVVDARTLTISAAAENGRPCGSWTGPAATTGEPQSVSGAVCSASRSSALNSGVTRYGFDSGIPNRLVVTSRVATPRGLVETRRAIDISREAACTALLCPVPEPRWYYLPLPYVPVSEESACWNTGCTGPREGSTGTARLLLTWVGPDTAQIRTTVGETVLAGAPGDAPRLDTTRAVLTQSGYEPATRSASATLQVAANTAGDYVVQLAAAPGYPACARPGAVLERSGSASTTPVRIEFSGLCAGATYLATVQLTDAAGNRSIWGPPSTRFPWVNGRLMTVEPDRVTVHWEYQVAGGFGTATGADRALVTGLDFAVGGYIVAGPRSFCASGASDSGTSVGARVGEQVSIRARATVQPATADCGPTNPLMLAESIVYDASIEALIAPGGVTLTSTTAEGTGGHLRLRVWVSD